MFVWNPWIIAAEVLLLFPLLALAFAGERVIRCVNRLPVIVRILLPALGGLAYYLVVHGTRQFRWSFVIFCAVLPVALVVLLWHASQLDQQQAGNWRD